MIVRQCVNCGNSRARVPVDGGYSHFRCLNKRDRKIRRLTAFMDKHPMVNHGR